MKILCNFIIAKTPTFQKLRSYLYLKTITVFQIYVYRCCRTPIKAFKVSVWFPCFLIAFEESLEIKRHSGRAAKVCC